MCADSPLDEHFHQPRNAGLLEDADVEVRVENPVCGDVLHLYVRRGIVPLEDGGEAAVVADVRFQVYGCPAAIAAGSVLTELIHGADGAGLGSVDAKAVSQALGGLPSEKYHASALAEDAVRALLECW